MVLNLLFKKNILYFLYSSLLFFFLNLFFNPILSDEQNQQGKALISNFFNNTKSLTARFSQSLVDSDNTLMETSEGSLKIKRPNLLLWEYKKPYDEKIIADGINLWIYDVDLKQVIVKPQAESFNNTPAELLTGEIDIISKYDFIDTLTYKEMVWVKMRPKNLENGFTQIEFGFQEGILTKIVFTDNLNQTTLIALMDLVINQDLDNEIFNFSLADDIDLIGTPIISDNRVTQ